MLPTDCLHLLTIDFDGAPSLVREALAFATEDGDAGMVDPRRYGSAGRDAVAVEVARLLHVIGGADDPVSAVE